MHVQERPGISRASPAGESARLGPALNDDRDPQRIRAQVACSACGSEPKQQPRFLMVLLRALAAWVT